MNENQEYLEPLPDSSSIKTPGMNTTLRFRTYRDDKTDDKTTVMINKNVLPSDTSPGKVVEVAEELSETYEAEITGYRPIGKYGPASDSPYGRPTCVFSPDGTRLERKTTYDWIVFYSSSAKAAKKELEVKIAERDEMDSKVGEILKDTDGHVKFQEIIITAEKLHEIQKKKEKRGKNGIPDQPQTMVREGVSKKEASATNIANILDLNSDELLWEWLHLIAFMFQGALAQKPDNMTGGTSYANTDTIMAENQVVHLAHLLKEEIHLRIASVEIPNTHISEKIIYTIITKKFTLPFVFDAQTHVKPSYSNQSYIHIFVQTLVKLTNNLLGANKSEHTKRRINFDNVVHSDGSETPEIPEIPEVPKKTYSNAPMPLMFFVAPTEVLTTKEELIKKEKIKDEQRSKKQRLITDSSKQEAIETKETKETDAAESSINMKSI